MWRPRVVPRWPALRCRRCSSSPSPSTPPSQPPQPRKLPSIRRPYERDLEAGAIGKLKLDYHKLDAKLKPREELPPPTPSSSFFYRLRHLYNTLMRVIETNDARYRKGELNVVFSKRWLLVYGIFALTLNGLWLALKYKGYREQEQLRPAVEERRKMMDPFEPGAVELNEEMTLPLKDPRSYRRDSMHTVSED
eukprot:Sspe_Gene.67881::Locus_40034_Transcript_2_2_Confidence_0.400_Length_683::g.67881::m.67881